jgi:exoribonuclease R
MSNILQSNRKRGEKQMNNLNKLIEDLSVLLADSTNERDIARDIYKALEKVTKSTRDLIRNLEVLKSLNGGSKK